MEQKRLAPDTFPLREAMDPGVSFLLISDVFETLAQNRPLKITLETIADLICSRLGYHSCAILLAQAEDDLLRIVGASGLSSYYVEAVNHSHPIHVNDLHLSEGPSSRAFRTGSPVLVEDTESDATFQRWRLLARQQRVRSLVALPLPSQGKLIGTLNCYQREPRQYPNSEIRTLMMVATQIGIAVDIARMVEAQQQTIGHLEDLSHDLQHQHRLLEQASRIHRMLTQLVLTNRGIPTIVGTLAREIGHPVLVQDQFFQVLTGADAQGHLTPDIPPLTEEALASYRIGAEDGNRCPPMELPALPQHGLHHPRAIAPILAGHQLLGYTSVALDKLPAPLLILHVLEQGNSVLAMEMVKERLAYEAERRIRRGFADDLITRRYDDAQQMRDRGRYFGYNLRGPFQVIVFDIDQFGHYVAEQHLTDAAIDWLRRRFGEAVQQVASTYLPHVLVAGRHDQLAMILSALDEKHAPERISTDVIRACRQLLPDLTVSVGIGQPYADLDHIATSHQEAKRALQFIRRLGGKAKTVAYTQLGISRLLFQVEDAGELIDFAQARLQPLLAYDQQRQGHLLTSLETYITSNASIPQAARRLGLHPNTFRYRLQKAEELLNVSLTDIPLLFELHLACLILRLIDSPSPEPANP